MHKSGWPFVIIISIISLFFFLNRWYLIAILSAFITLFFIYFFRDPERFLPLEPNAIVSPADGQVVFLGIDRLPFSQEKAQKVSIFMSLFDVHVNRVPFDGEVKKIEYKKGRFLPAYKTKASIENEANIVFFSTEEGKFFVIVQIAGILARRIICHLKPGQKVKKGERLGIICFGSKVELYLPTSVKLKPLLGKHVKAGETILGYWS
ncbi:MAG: phosphatidylserine decarboxylase family protein [Candidatus Desulfofervidus auxilii]|nr:phosphatidylserine decarboxylase family protein [Candidatus Desulfofervidus auxilii]